METQQIQYGVVSWSSRSMPSPQEIESIKYHLSHVMPQLVGMEWQFNDKASTDRMSLSVRRVNLPNLGQSAFAILKFGSVYDISPHLLELWSKAATDVLDPRPGDVVIDADIFRIDECKEIVAESCPPKFSKRHAKAPRRSVKRSLRGFWDDWVCSSESCSLNEMMLAPAQAPAAPSPSLEDQEDEQIAALDREQQRAIEEIQAAIIRYVTTFHADPKELLLKLQGIIVIDDKPSPLVVNKDMDIVLPHYDEIKVDMPPMCKTVYILFLLHPEGIVLKNFAEHRSELEQIYNIVMPNRDDDLAQNSIDNLCSPLSNTLNEYIAKIKKSFRRYVRNDDLLKNYVITGRRGNPYRVALSPDLITLPAAFTAGLGSDR